MSKAASLAEAAEAARANSAKEQQQQIRNAKQQALDSLLKRWEERWRSIKPVPAIPDHAEFEFGSAYNYGWRGGQEISGWRFTVDGIPFIYSTSHGNEGLHVLLTCPDCGVEQADSFYGLESLGRLLKTQKDLAHHCYESEVRSLTGQVKMAANALKVSPHYMVSMVVERLASE